MSLFLLYLSWRYESVVVSTARAPVKKDWERMKKIRPEQLVLQVLPGRKTQHNKVHTCAPFQNSKTRKVTETQMFLQP